MAPSPAFESAAPIQFVINTAAGSSDVHCRRTLIEQALQAQGRRSELQF